MDDFSKFLDELKLRANIVDVVSSYATLVRKSGHYWACCPLHVEKTASFKLDEATNTYHCFGCGKHGDVISFIMDIEKTDFMGAVKFLARRYNLEVPTKTRDKNFSENKKKRDRLYALTHETGLYYHNNLMGPNGKKALEYLYSRGITMDTIKKFGLGYSTGRYDLINYLRSKNFTDEEMEEAKVAYIPENRKTYDPQAERFVTPIINSTKDIIAFGGRIIEKKPDNISKYYNSMESFIFHKSRELFGQHILKTLRNIDNAILVEGYMDVISLYQAGIHNAVASMGTALTEDQARLLKRFVSKVYFMYDGDSAGQKGMMRGVDILKSVGLDVQCVVLEDNLDPDEYIKKFGAEAMKKKIYEQSMPMYQYKINAVAKNYNLNSPEERGAFAAAAVEVIKNIEFESQVEPILQFISDKTAITYSHLLEQFNSARSGKSIAPKSFNITKNYSDRYTRAVRYIIYAAFGGVEGVEVKDEFVECMHNDNLIALYNMFRQNTNLILEDLEELRSENPEVENILEDAKKIDLSIARQYYIDCRNLVLKELYTQKKQQLVFALKDADEKTIQLIATQLEKINSDLKQMK